MKKVLTIAILTILLTTVNMSAMTFPNKASDSYIQQVPKVRAAQGAPVGSPPGTPEYMWEWPMYQIWYAYYQSKVYHYYFGGISVFDE